MKIIVKAVAGSHLFGTNTESSDKDYHGVFFPDVNDILLGKVKDSISIKTNKESNTKNTKDDIDIKYYSLKKFMEMLHEGQTEALELLFTPEDMILEKDGIGESGANSIWDALVFRRSEFLHAGVNKFSKYCRDQADKYGIKGSRMASLKKVTADLKDYLKHNPDLRLKTIIDVLEKDYYHIEHVAFPSFDSSASKTVSIRMIEVCDRKFQETVRVDYVVEALEKLYDTYGDRSKQAMENKGIDWKALSHSYRVCTQAIELMNTGHITLPLPEKTREVCKAIKTGRLSFINEVKPLLERSLEEVYEASKTTKLPDKLDKEKCDGIVTYAYRSHILNSIWDEPL